jgi:hypothetical protein
VARGFDAHAGKGDTHNEFKQPNVKESENLVVPLVGIDESIILKRALKWFGLDLGCQDIDQ